MSIQSQRLWAMEPGRLSGLFRDMKAKGLPDAKARAAASAASNNREEPLYERLGPLAVVGMSGPMSKNGDWWWGYASMRQIGSSLLQAAADSSAKAILLDADNAPGGTVDGTEELAGIARFVGEQKPLYVYASGMLASAHYWVASQAKEIATNETDLIGSIGVLQTHTDWSGWNEQMGVDVTYLTAGHYKAIANPDQPLSDEARAYLQDGLDRIYDLFLDAVATGRGVTREQALAMADGKIFLGRQALELGLVDRLESRADFINRIITEVHMDLAKLKAEHPGVVTELRAEVETELAAGHTTAVADAVSGEQARVLGIVGVLVGEATGKRIADVVASGVTAEQATAMGAALGIDPAKAQSEKSGEVSADAKRALKAMEGAASEPLNQSGDPRAAAPDFDALVQAKVDKGLSRGKALAEVIRENPKAHAAWLAKRGHKEGD